jgi:small subunit ribosomal protein S6
LRRYETILIAHVDLSEDELSSLIARYGGIVTAQKGILVKVERWGKRRLAYLIKKQARGFYILIDYAGLSAVVNELERNLKIDDKILKFMTVLKDEAVDPAALEKEMADAVKKDEKKEEPAPAPAPAPEAVLAAIPAPAPEAALAVAAAETDAPVAPAAQTPIPEETKAKGEKEL